MGGGALGICDLPPKHRSEVATYQNCAPDSDTILPQNGVKIISIS